MPAVRDMVGRLTALRLACGLLALCALAGEVGPGSVARAEPAPAKVPVFFLVLDELPGASIQDPQGGIDPQRMPNLHAIARQATWYPNASTNGAMTMYSFPSFLSGRLWRGADPPADRTLFAMLRRTHRVYQGERWPTIRRLCGFCDHDARPARRIFGAPIGGNDWQLPSIRQGYSEIRSLSAKATSSGRPLMWHSHVILPHAPFQFLASGRRYPLNLQSHLPSITAANGILSANRRLVHADQQRFLVQLALTDRFVGLLRRQLTRAGLWDRSMVIITSDHGSSTVSGTRRRQLVATNFSQVTSVPLVVKYPGQEKGKVDAGSAQLVDLLPTIAQVTGTRPGWRLDGLSLLAPRPEREVKAYANQETGWLTMGFREFVARRALDISDWNRLFPGPAQTTWMGARPSLRGRSVGALKVGASSATATIAEAPLLRRVSRRSGVIPALISGTLEGVPGGRPLALAINGTVAAGGWSYFKDGKTRFNILIPEKDLKDGPNTVELFQMQNGRPARIAVR